MTYPFKRVWLVKRVLPILALLLLPSMADAHVGVGSANSIAEGFMHPLTGLDHICAMMAVGLWAAQRGGRAVWLVPLPFVCVMALAGVVGATGFSLPFVEQGIVLSLLVLGALVATAARLPLFASLVIVALFAVFHGHTHGAEIPQTVLGLAYGIGFILATMLLHACGIGIVYAVAGLRHVQLARIAGLIITSYGAYLCFA